MQSAKQANHDAAQAYSLKPLFEAPLEDGVSITCVEYWDGNLYIGTSSGEVIHFVSLPPADGDEETTFIQASRIGLSEAENAAVKQIAVLPAAGKACILCDGNVSFHTLPELSPAAGHRKVPNCKWIGGRDLDADTADGEVIMISTRSRIRIVRLSADQRPQLLKDIEYPGCLGASRRDRYACVADSHSYALLDIEIQQKIPLFPISSIDENAAQAGGRPEELNATSHQRSSSAAERGLAVQKPSHGRATSLGNIVDSLGLSQGSRPQSRDRSGQASPTRPPVPPKDSPSEESPAPPAPSAPVQQVSLPPQILSPLPSEFLLITGTTPDDPGVGIFVNCDGDVVRGTLEFSKYPLATAVDASDDDDGYVLAAVMRDRLGIEMQKLDGSGRKGWLPTEGSESVGLVKACSQIELSSADVGSKLKLRRFVFSGDEPEGDDARNAQEDEFAKRLDKTSADVIYWQGSSLKWLVQNSLLTRMDATIERIVERSQKSRLDQTRLIQLMASIRSLEPKSETEFRSLEYVRQKIGIILFADVAANQVGVSAQLNENLFLEGLTDPRVLLSVIPLLHSDIVRGDGIWIHHGIIEAFDKRLRSISVNLDTDEVLTRPQDFDMFNLVKKFLYAWRQKKGFGSVTDDEQVFATVDAALLHLLLHQDQQSDLGPGKSSQLRVEIYQLVDNNIACFDRAVQLLEEYQRLYVLSRLFQSKNMRSRVLGTWQRILDGAKDQGREFGDGESQMRQYLIKTRDASLVEEFGTWLAARNPVTGIQVFTDDSSRVKLAPEQVVQLLQKKAPGAVKDYLEHLVFSKKDVRYANDLVFYYLDNVLAGLESEDARSTLKQSYAAYRALEAPKPTYRQFITDNVSPQGWWNDRLRVLELLGGSYGSSFAYDTEKILARIEPFEEYLVPESIILEGRQGHHQQAIRLLTHGLGDYHTAINYCLLGGSSIFHPTQMPAEIQTPSQADQDALFKSLLDEFLVIENEQDRVQRTSELLGRFGTHYELEHVLSLIPESWPLDSILDFLASAFRRLVEQRNTTMITKALSGAENLRISTEWADYCEKAGPHVVPAMDTPESMS